MITPAELADCFAVVEARQYYVVSVHGNAMDVKDEQAWSAQVRVTPGIPVGELLLKGQNSEGHERDFWVTIAGPVFPDPSRYERELEIE